MKKILTYSIMTVFVIAAFLITTPVSAQENQNGLLFGISTTTYWEDGTKKTALTYPTLTMDITYMPLRIVTEYLGKTVTYNPSDSSATVTDPITGDWITFSQETNIAVTNKGNLTLQRNPFIQSDCYMIPVRLLSEYFQAGVYWHDETSGILVTKAPTTEQQETYKGLMMRYHDKGYYEDGIAKRALTRVEIFNGTSYLPLRLVSEYLGAKVTWNEADFSATLTMEGTDKWLSLNQNTNVIQTNSGNITVERNPFIQDDCYMVPVRVISEFFGCTVSWNQDLMSFLITKLTVSESERNTKFALLQDRFNYIKLLEDFRKTESPYTRVINRTYKIPANYIGGSGQLSSVRGVQMESQAAAALSQMLQGLNSAGLSIQVNSGYRTDATQEYLYNRQIGRQGGNALKAATISAIPLSSEHQAGLAVDLSTNGVLSSAFASTAQGKWLAAHCADYGFIIRYTASKQRITGIIFEPWHFRYVGSPEMAKAITNSGLCMEEYFNKYLADGDITPYLPYL